MGIFDDVTAKVRGMADGSESGLLKGVMEMLSDPQSGGLGGIIQSFQQKGLGNIISSWVSTGPNQAISPGQLREGLGEERVRQVAQKAGLSTDETAGKLSQMLPEVVDKATPDGKVPEGGIIDKGLDFLKSRLS